MPAANSMHTQLERLNKGLASAPPMRIRPAGETASKIQNNSTMFMLAMKNQSRFSVSHKRMVTNVDAATSGKVSVKAINSMIVTLLIKKTG